MSDQLNAERVTVSSRTADSLLRVLGVSKSFALPVLDQVDFELRSGEIHGLLGANGAGKSTLCKIIAGLLPPSLGSMELLGKPYAPASKYDAECLGVQIVQQELNLIPTLTVAENLMLSRLPSSYGIIRTRELKSLARRALDRLELSMISTDTLVGKLGIGFQQMLEIAGALDRDCKVLILDEPTASLSASESERLFRWLRILADNGVGMIYISHRLDEVLKLCDRVTVLRDGKYIETCSTKELSIEHMVAMMTGFDSRTRDAGKFCTHIKNAQPAVSDAPALSIKNFSRKGSVQDVAFDVKAGERLGIAGLVGSGRTELLRLIFGADPADAGEVWIHGKRLSRRFRHPAEAVKAGIAMVTEDRKNQGLMLSQSICMNSSLGSLKSRFSMGGFVRKAAERDAVSECNRSLATHYANLNQPVQTLSGGNQQKVVISRWLLRDASIFFFDEPTRGIDIAARWRIYELIESLAAQGKAIVIVSSDLEELFETCDRIVVMLAGKLVGNFVRPDWSHDRIMHAAFSGYTRQEQH